MKTDSKKLREYCSEHNLQLERCRKPGFWIVVFGKRPNASEFNEFRKAVMKYGYMYFRDGIMENDKYYIIINSK